MNEQLEGRPAARAMTTGDRIDVVCDAFERQWLRSMRPRIEDYLNASGIHERSRLFRELLAVELEYRHRASEPFTASEYAARFGDLAPDVDAVFQSAAAADTDPGKRDPSVLAQHPDALTRVNAASIAGQPRTDPLAATMTLADVSGSSPLGKFRLMQVVGRGAFGEVYRAYDTELDRYVAVKLPRHSDMDSVETSRFLREAKNVSRLTHPGIVPVFDVGRTDSSCYIISEFVEGPTLAEELLRRHFSFREAADLVAHIGDALEHAHRAGVIHRDLKPSNILLDTHVDPTPSTSSSSRSRGAATGKSFPRIVDFGLGKRSLGGASLMAGDEVIGTPAYMSPEQAAGHSHAVDGRSDVYSLGVVLYQMLTGELPFHGDLSQVLDRVINEPPKRPREINAAIPRDLEVICLKCLAKQRDSRYFSASEVSADLRRWLEGMPILARPAPLLERAWSWCRRHAGVAAMIVLTSLVAATGAVAVYLEKNQRAESDRLAAEKTINQLIEAQSPRLESELANVHADLANLEPHILERLREDLSMSERGQMRLRLALLPNMPEFAPVLLDSMLSDATDAHEFVVLRKAIKPQAKAFTDKLVQRLDQTQSNPAAALRPLLALLEYGGADVPAVVDPAAIAEGLAHTEESETAVWVGAAINMKNQLAPELEALSSAVGRRAVRLGACRALVALHADDIEPLVHLVWLADDAQHRLLVDALEPHKVRAVELLKARLDRPRDPAKEVSAESFARQQAGVLAALIQLGGEQHAWPHLVHRLDPRVQTYFIHTADAKGLSPKPLIGRLQSENDPGLLYCLLLTLGSYSENALGLEERRRLVPRLSKLYKQHSDPGVHSSARWLFTHWGLEPEINDNERAEMRAVKRDRHWFYNSLGQCMVIVRGPVTFQMGSPADEPGRNELWDGKVRERTIGRSFAIAATETTINQFRQFHKDVKPDLDKFPTPDYPIASVNWEEAVNFCDGLNHSEGAPAETNLRVESPTSDGQKAVAMHIDTTKTGYRLPTDAEWEYACRAGVPLSRFFGSSDTNYEEKYAWCSTDGRASGVGRKMPNRYGLFDIYGNVHEFTSSVLTRQTQEAVDDTVSLSVNLTEKQVTYVSARGGNHGTKPEFLRSAARDPATSLRKAPGIGFRIARTLDDREE